MSAAMSSPRARAASTTRRTESIKTPHPGWYATLRWKISAGSPAFSLIVTSSLIAPITPCPSSRMWLAYVPPYFAAAFATSTNSSVVE